MKKSRFFVFLGGLILVSISASSNASTVTAFDNNTFECICTVDVQGPFAAAVQFTPSATGLVQDVTVRLDNSANAADRNANFSLFTSGGNQPGTLVGSVDVVVPASFGSSSIDGADFSIAGWGPEADLSAGSSYWLVAKGTSGLNGNFLGINWFGGPTVPNATRWFSTDGGATWGLGVGVTSLRMSVQVVPIPAAAWLFGSGLLGLIGIARRKKAA
jgi:hypothetical protein